MRSLLKILPVLILLILLGLFLIPSKESGCNSMRIFQKRQFNIHLPYGYSVHGIDVSRYQLTIDWDEVAKAKEGKHQIRFAFMKATQGIQLTDTTFKRNWVESKRAGIVRGAYHYFEPSKDARQQANYFLSRVKLEKGDLPPMLDVEEQGKLSRKQLQEKVKIWLQTVEKSCGVKPILYCGPAFYRNILQKKFEEYPLWIAHYYRYQLSNEFKWRFWQHSDKGKVPGIKGHVDFNVFHGSKAGLDSMRIK